MSRLWEHHPVTLHIGLPFPDHVEAICTADIHLTLKAPIARDEEKDWLKAMSRSLKQLAWLSQEHNAPLIMAGDVFDKPSVPPELMNWALDHLPTHLGCIYAVPGNHDLPTHRYDLMHKGSYGTLVRAGRIVNLGPEPLHVGMMALYGRPLGGPIPKRLKHHSDALGLLHVLVSHEFIWTGQHGYQGAPEDRKLKNVAKQFRSFGVVVAGDCHQGFLRQLKNGTWVLVPGTLMRRKVDEADYRPRVGLIWRSGKVTLHYLNTSKDKISMESSKKDVDPEIAEFVRKLEELEPTSLSFRDALMRALDELKVSKGTRGVISEAMP